MRRLTFMCLLAAFLSPPASNAQSLTPAQVPTAVRQSFAARFPAIKTVEWKRKTDRNYEAEFTHQRVESAVKFDSVGTWIETETTIPRSSLPAAVRDSVVTRFPGHTIIETQTLERRNQKRLDYEVHAENAVEVVKLQLTPSGQVLSVSSKPKAK